MEVQVPAEMWVPAVRPKRHLAHQAPDYLAATLADIRPDMSYSKDNFGEKLHGSFVDSPNNCVMQLSSSGKSITTRHVQFRS